MMYRKVHTMWENEIVVLLTSLKKRILSGKEKAQFRKISEDEAIPVYVKAYFQKLYEGYLSQEIPFKIQSTKHFVFSDEEIVRFQERLKDVLKEATFFPADEVENVLRDAIYLRLDYYAKTSFCVKSGSRGIIY